VADRLVVMAGGRIVAEGSPETVLSPALVRRVYGIGTLAIRHPRSGRPILLPEHGPLAGDPDRAEARHA
jgi:ABC-type hemin transport system ATPase subunit